MSVFTLPVSNSRFIVEGDIVADAYQLGRIAFVDSIGANLSQGDAQFDGEIKYRYILDPTVDIQFTLLPIGSDINPGYSCLIFNKSDSNVIDVRTTVSLGIILPQRCAKLTAKASGTPDEWEFTIFQGRDIRGNFLYVDAEFGGSAGQRNSFGNSYPTIQSAVADSVPGDVIYVRPGNYFVGVFINVSDLVIYCAPGAFIDSAFFTTNSGTDYNIYGYGEFNNGRFNQIYGGTIEADIIEGMQMTYLTPKNSDNLLRIRNLTNTTINNFSDFTINCSGTVSITTGTIITDAGAGFNGFINELDGNILVDTASTHNGIDLQMNFAETFIFFRNVPNVDSESSITCNGGDDIDIRVEADIIVNVNTYSNLSLFMFAGTGNVFGGNFRNARFEIENATLNLTCNSIAPAVAQTFLITNSTVNVFINLLDSAINLFSNAMFDCTGSTLKLRVNEIIGIINSGLVESVNSTVDVKVGNCVPNVGGSGIMFTLNNTDAFIDCGNITNFGQFAIITGGNLEANVGKAVHSGENFMNLTDTNVRINIGELDSSSGLANRFVFNIDNSALNAIVKFATLTGITFVNNVSTNVADVNSFSLYVKEANISSGNIANLFNITGSYGTVVFGGRFVTDSFTVDIRKTVGTLRLVRASLIGTGGTTAGIVYTGAGTQVVENHGRSTMRSASTGTSIVGSAEDTNLSFS